MKMRIQNNAQIQGEIKTSQRAVNISAEKNVILYDEYRIDRNIALRYMSVCTPDFTGDVDGYTGVYSALIILNEDDVDVETKFIYDIARNGQEAYRIMKLLSDNGVTPDTAEEIITEIL